MPSKFRKAIAAVKDQTSISLAKVSGTNCSNLDVAVLKATTHEEIPVEDRFLNEVVLLTTSSRSYACACVHALSRRITRTRNWIVALKSLTLIFRILQEGDPHFAQAAAHAMRHGARLLNLSSFRDDSNSSPWDYTAFVRTFALYLDERLDCFLMGKLHRGGTTAAAAAHHHHHHRGHGRSSEHINEMKPAILLDKISYWQRLLDRALATRPTGPAKSNRLLQISLYSIVRESFDLYKEISDGLTLLLDNFFHLEHRSCVEAFHVCNKAAKQFDELSTFYTLCKSLGIGRTSEYPSVRKISDRLLETLQEFLKDNQSSLQVVKPIKEGRQMLALPAPTKKDSMGSEPSEEHSDLDLKDESNSEEETEKASEASSGPRTPEEDLLDLKETNPSSSPSSSVDQADGDLIQVIQETNTSRTSPLVDQENNSGCLDMVPSGPENVDHNPSLTTVLFKEQPQQQQHDHMQAVETTCFLDGTKGGWEMVLAESATTKSDQLSYNTMSVFDPSVLENSYGSPSSIYQSHIQSDRNPFLQGGSTESNIFLSEAYSSSLPTFCAKNPELALPPEADPFSSVYCFPSSPNHVLLPLESTPSSTGCYISSPSHSHTQTSVIDVNQNVMYMLQQQQPIWTHQHPSN